MLRQWFGWALRNADAFHMVHTQYGNVLFLAPSPVSLLARLGESVLKETQKSAVI